MDITFTCPHCGEVTLIDEAFVGQSGPCRTCDRVVTVSPLVVGGGRFRRFSEFPAAPVSQFLVWLGWISILAPVACILLLPLLPSVGSQGPSRRMQSGNNLKQIALAMLEYHSVHRALPRAYWLTSDGQRTLSWRVALLPYLEKRPLFEQYRPRESWRSAANWAVGRQPCDTFTSPWNTNAYSRETSYMVITGPGTLFEEGKDLSLADCTDGPENTILAVEVTDSDVNWAEPEDLDIRTMVFEINKGRRGISSEWSGGATVAFADGSVRSLTKETLAKALHAMITRAGGETVLE